MHDWINKLIHHRNFFFRFGSTQKTAEQLLRLVPSAIVAGTNVDIAEVSEMYMSDLQAYRLSTLNMIIGWENGNPRRTNQTRFNLLEGSK